MKRKLYFLVLAALLAALLLPVVVVPASATASMFINQADTGLSIPTGDTYGSYDFGNATYQATKPLDRLPLTFEAWVNIPSSLGGARPGVILGNFNPVADGSFYFHINEGNLPQFNFYDKATGTNHSYKFSNSKIAADAWTHLVLTYDSTAAKISCYINGVFSESKSISGTPMLLEDVNRYTVCLGGTHHWMNYLHFKAGLQDVAAYGSVLSAAEIKAAYENGVDTGREDLILYYDVDSTDIGGDIADASGNGYDLTYSQMWLSESEMAALREAKGFGDYAYSFAVIGDTQSTTYLAPDKLDALYQWIVDNKESKKIEYVIGLGDITENDTAEEWEVAKNAISILDGSLEYSLIRGNHDTLEGGTLFDTHFASNPHYTAQFEQYGGFYEAGSVTNTWRTLQVAKTDWLIVNIDWTPSAEELAWASDVIAAHPEHKVIVNTHRYLNSRGETYDYVDSTWTSLCAKHSNIELLLCGHVSTDDLLVTNTLRADGSAMHAILIDPQKFDQYLGGGLDMIAMFYFNEDGTEFDVEYYSPTRNQYFKTGNQLSINLNEVPDVIIDEVPESPVHILDQNGATLAVYQDLSEALAAFSTLGNAHTIKLNENFTYSTGITLNKSMVLDGNGHTLNFGATAGNLITVSGVTVTLKDLKVFATDTTSSTHAIHTTGAASLTLTNVDITGGTNESGQLLAAGYHAIYVAGASTQLTINSGTYSSYASALYLADVSNTSVINGGKFISAGAISLSSTNKHAATVYAGSNTTLTINGGFFSYVDADPSKYDISTTGSAVQNAYGNSTIATLRINSTSPVIINGGTFLSGNSNASFALYASVKLTINDCNVYGYSWVRTYTAIKNAVINIYGGYFTHNIPGQDNAISHRIAHTIQEFNIYGGTFHLQKSGANTSSGCITTASNGGNTINIYGGSFTVDSTKAAGIIYAAIATTVSVHPKGTAITGADGKATTSTGATFTRNNAGYLFITTVAGNSLTIGAGNTVCLNGGTAIFSWVGTVTVNGGTFILPTGSLATASSGTLTLNSAVIVANKGSLYGDIVLDDYAADIMYGGSSYKVWVKNAASGESAPALESGAALYVSTEIEATSGIRFSTSIAASAIKTLTEAGYTIKGYGTLIAPADYVAMAGKFTVEALSNLSFEGVKYVNIPAVNTLKNEEDGTVTFSGTLVNLKSNTRSYAAVSYIEVTKDGATEYIYSAYDSNANARTAEQIADAMIAANGEYMMLSTAEKAIVDAYAGGIVE